MYYVISFFYLVYRMNIAKATTLAQKIITEAQNTKINLIPISPNILIPQEEKNKLNVGAMKNLFHTIHLDEIEKYPQYITILQSKQSLFYQDSKEYLIIQNVIEKLQKLYKNKKNYISGMISIISNETNKQVIIEMIMIFMDNNINKTLSHEKGHLALHRASREYLSMEKFHDPLYIQGDEAFAIAEEIKTSQRKEALQTIENINSLIKLPTEIVMPYRSAYNAIQRILQKNYWTTDDIVLELYKETQTQLTALLQKI